MAGWTSPQDAKNTATGGTIGSSQGWVAPAKKQLLLFTQYANVSVATIAAPTDNGSSTYGTWTAIGSQLSFGPAGALDAIVFWYKVASGNETTITYATPTGATGGGGLLYEIDGFYGLPKFDQTAQTDSTPNTNISITSSPATRVGPYELAVSAMGVSGGSGPGVTGYYGSVTGTQYPFASDAVAAKADIGFATVTTVQAAEVWQWAWTTSGRSGIIGALFYDSGGPDLTSAPKRRRSQPATRRPSGLIIPPIVQATVVVPPAQVVLEPRRKPTVSHRPVVAGAFGAAVVVSLTPPQPEVARPHPTAERRRPSVQAIVPPVVAGSPAPPRAASKPRSTTGRRKAPAQQPPGSVASPSVAPQPEPSRKRPGGQKRKAPAQQPPLIPPIITAPNVVTPSQALKSRGVVQRRKAAQQVPPGAVTVTRGPPQPKPARSRWTRRRAQVLSQPVPQPAAAVAPQSVSPRRSRAFRRSRQAAQSIPVVSGLRVTQPSLVRRALSFTRRRQNPTTAPQIPSQGFSQPTTTRRPSEAHRPAQSPQTFLAEPAQPVPLGPPQPFIRRAVGWVRRRLPWQSQLPPAAVILPPPVYPGNAEGYLGAYSAVGTVIVISGPEPP